MTENKPIYVDGVDVAGCEFHSSTPSSELCYMKGNKCNDNLNCYFKQLARKTQECEILKRDNSTLFDKAMETRKENVELQVQLDQLKAEKEKLKANNETWKTIDIIFDNGVTKTQISDLSLAEYSQLRLEKNKPSRNLSR